MDKVKNKLHIYTHTQKHKHKRIKHKQVIEKYFNESFKALYTDGYITKLQVNPYAHTKTAADYFIQLPDKDVLVECKQVSLNTKKPVFNIDRVTQEVDLIEWSNRFDRNEAFLFVCFWNKNRANSIAFFIPIQKWVRFKLNTVRKNFNKEMFQEIFKHYQCDRKGKYWVLNFNDKYV